MKIDHYISQLLFQYDCVIVPDFGGFIGNYKPATIQAIQNTFNPPSKQISFNKNLNSNDGLLANYIAQIDELTYPEACEKIAAYVHHIQQKLSANNKVTIDEIGVLFMDAENRLQFEPKSTNNYLLEAYGLNSFQKFPIKRDTLEDKITKEFKDRTAPLAVVKNDTKSKKWLVAAAITIPLISFAIWLPTKYDLTSNINFANLNPFPPTPKAIYTERKTAPEFEKIKDENLTQQIAEASADDYFITILLDENEVPLVVQLKEKPVAEAVSTYVATNRKDLHYHIVGGCFSSKRNAKKLVAQLKKEGFNASIIGQRKGLWTVAYNSVATRKEAVEALANAKTHNEKAWVLNY